MTRNSAIANRIREVFLNGQWIANTNFRDQLSRVSWQQANQRIGSLNTVAMLTFHVNYYVGGVLTVLNGGPLSISDRYSFDSPEIRCEEDWNALVNDFLTNAERFADHVEQMDSSILDRPFVEEKYGTCHRNIEAMIEHAYYHLGQVSLIRKMIGSASPPA